MHEIDDHIGSDVVEIKMMTLKKIKVCASMVMAHLVVMIQTTK